MAMKSSAAKAEDPKPLSGGSSLEDEASFSPDGRWLAYPGRLGDIIPLPQTLGISLLSLHLPCERPGAMAGALHGEAAAVPTG